MAGLIFNERHTDDDTLILIPALYSIGINKFMFPSQRKRNSHVTCLRRQGFWFAYKRSRDINKCASRIDGVTPHNFACIKVGRLLLPGSFRDVPVDYLYVFNTLVKIQIVQSFSDGQFQS